MCYWFHEPGLKYENSLNQILLALVSAGWDDEDQEEVKRPEPRIFVLAFSGAGFLFGHPGDGTDLKLLQTH